MECVAASATGSRGDSGVHDEGNDLATTASAPGSPQRSWLWPAAPEDASGGAGTQPGAPSPGKGPLPIDEWATVCGFTSTPTTPACGARSAPPAGSPIPPIPTTAIRMRAPLSGSGLLITPSTPPHLGWGVDRALNLLLLPSNLAARMAGEDRAFAIPLLTDAHRRIDQGGPSHDAVAPPRAHADPCVLRTPGGEGRQRGFRVPAVREAAVAPPAQNLFLRPRARVGAAHGRGASLITRTIDRDGEVGGCVNASNARSSAATSAGVQVNELIAQWYRRDTYLAWIPWW